MECSPCPNDPNYVPEDPAKFKARLDAAVDRIRENEKIRAYIPKIEVAKEIPPGYVEVGVYTCPCAICGKHYQSNNKRSAYCGC